MTRATEKRIKEYYYVHGFEGTVMAAPIFCKTGEEVRSYLRKLSLVDGLTVHTQGYENRKHYGKGVLFGHKNEPYHHTERDMLENPNYQMTLKEVNTYIPYVERRDFFTRLDEVKMQSYINS